MYRLIIFDIDNTLIATEDAIIAAFAKLTKERLHKTFPSKELQRIRGATMENALKHFGITGNLQEWADTWNRYIKEMHDKVYVYPGIFTVLDTLKTRNIQFASVTSKTRAEYLQDMNALGLYDYFSIYYCSDMLTNPKPDPEGVFKIMERTNTQTQDILFVGDTKYDSLCAKNAGVDFALAGWGAATKDIANTYCLQSPKDILKLI